VVAMIILRSKMNPFAAIWYRFINDPLQIYLTVVCFWMILSGRMPTTRKIWSQVPRSGVVVGGTVSRKVGVDAVQVPVSARTTGGIPLAEVTQVSAEEWEHETAQVPEEAEWQRETAETKALPMLRLDGDTARAPEATEKAEPHPAVSNGAEPHAAPNGAVPNGAAPNGAVSSGLAPNGTAPNGAGEASEPVWSDGAAAADLETDMGPIPRVSWEPEETDWDTDALRLPERDSEDADGHSEANGHPEADDEILPAERS
jgi:hypothetical protein